MHAQGICIPGHRAQYDARQRGKGKQDVLHSQSTCKHKRARDQPWAPSDDVKMLWREGMAGVWSLAGACIHEGRVASTPRQPEPNAARHKYGRAKGTPYENVHDRDHHDLDLARHTWLDIPAHPQENWQLT